MNLAKAGYTPKPGVSFDCDGALSKLDLTLADVGTGELLKLYVTILYGFLCLIKLM